MRGRFVGAIVVAFLFGAALPLGYLWVQRAETESASGEAKQLWTCGMHPQVVQDEPGNCPICQMKLTPLDSAAPTEPETAQAAAMKGPGPAVRVSPGFLQNFAIRTVAAERGSIPVDLRTVGVLGYDEKRIVTVNTKFGGWIEKAHINYVGEKVERGDLLFEVYSPELVTAQKEFLAAVEYFEELSAGGKRSAVERARALVDAARERLRWWDVSDEHIDELGQTKTVIRTLKVYSPISGMVVEKMGDSLEGMKLNPGMNVFKIADLSTLWAEIEIYEYQLDHARLGQTAHISVNAFAGRHWMGKIVYLDPTLNQQTRTLKAKVEIANPGWKLRPAMYADVEIRPAAASGVVRVPDEVVLHTGERSVVIVQKEASLFEPREVTLGAAGGGWQEVRQGLQAGEMVVSSSQFLIDSESNLREAISKMLADSGSEAAAPAHQH